MKMFVSNFADVISTSVVWSEVRIDGHMVSGVCHCNVCICQICLYTSTLHGTIV